MDQPGSTGIARPWRGALLGAALLFVSLAGAASPPEPTLLDPARGSADVPVRSTWIGPEDPQVPQRAVSGALPFAPTDHGKVHSVPRGQFLWMHLRVQPTSQDGAHWVLDIPMPVLDAVTLHERDAQGAWRSRTAGDSLAVDRWPEPGRHPVFRLQPTGGEVRDLVLQIRHSTPLSLPLQLFSATEFDRRIRLEYLGLGMVLGALALLVVGTVVRALRLRDAGYGWYAAYALLSTLATAALTGIAGHLLWSGSPRWNDAAPGCMALLAAGCALWIARLVTGIASRAPRLGAAMYWAACTSPLLAVLYPIMGRTRGIAMAGVYLLCVAVLSLWAAAFTWRRGDPVGRWMLMGAVPLAISVFISLARVFGWIEASWLTEYALLFALTLDLPMLLGALHSRSRERRGAQLRQLAAERQDPMTGLLKAQPFGARLAQAMERLTRRGEGAAVAVIALANYERIKAARGAEAAEECLLRAVIKLRKLVRDIDTTGRLGEARFGLILEGVASRAAVSHFASRLIASGLMTEADHPDDPELQFHVVANLLTEHAPSAAELMLSLLQALGAMSPRTHRPFRFLDPQAQGHASQPGSVPLDEALNAAA